MKNTYCACCGCLLSEWLFWRKNGNEYCSEDCAERDETSKW